MSSFLKNQIKSHKTTSTVVLAVYLIVTTSVDLFHSEHCTGGVVYPSTTEVLFHEDECPACMFSAVLNSTITHYGPIVVSTEYLYTSQFIPQLVVIDHDEWHHSIILRAPPSITIS
jgi:hypothetical protein